jgi:phosphate transport system protein
MNTSGFSQHISQQFNTRLEAIRDRVLAMGGHVEKQLADAMTALIKSNLGLAQDVVAIGEMINDMELELDESCVHVLARYQPAASDLRLIIAVIKTISELERIGDEAERIARMALESNTDQALLTDMQLLGNGVRKTLHDALDCFARLDAKQAVAVALSDLDTDRRYEAILLRIMEHMKEDPPASPRLMNLMWAARSLERVGDRACNICEYVIYLVKGKDVRHTKFEKLAERAGVEPEQE